jgi:hypothetical protein
MGVEFRIIKGLGYCVPYKTIVRDDKIKDALHKLIDAIYDNRGDTKVYHDKDDEACLFLGIVEDDIFDQRVDANPFYSLPDQVKREDENIKGGFKIHGSIALSENYTYIRDIAEKYGDNIDVFDQYKASNDTIINVYMSALSSLKGEVDNAIVEYLESMIDWRPNSFNRWLFTYFH